VTADEALLDNPVYAALSGPHERFAHVRGRARRYPPDVAPMLGLPAEPSNEDWRDAAELVGPGGYVAIQRDGDDLPAGWQVIQVFDLVQMVEERASAADCPEAVALGTDDVPEMLELVAATEPGPFMSRTVELGRYLGIRREGTLVAMAGERFRVDGWTEISAVCTLPSHRGHGLATALMGALIGGIHHRSERAFLHALASNTGAIRLYEQLGFRVRLTGPLTLVTPAGAPTPSS
jgi:ribosomal protein S18 acetylase RimI-like enzyme